MRKPTIDQAQDIREREKALDTAVDRLGLRLAQDDTIEPDPVMADLLEQARPGAEAELMRLCGELQGDGGEDLELPPAAWEPH